MNAAAVKRVRHILFRSRGVRSAFYIGRNALLPFARTGLNRERLTRTAFLALVAALFFGALVVGVGGHGVGPGAAAIKAVSVGTGGKDTAVPAPDMTPPAILNIPLGIVQEANGPTGSAIAYVPPTAIDDVAGPVPVACSPPPGATFPLGVSTIVCIAADPSRNVSVFLFTVRVRDSTPPVLNAPPDIVVDAVDAGGAPKTHPTIAALLTGVMATDVVDPAPVVTNDAPAVFPIGATTVTFTAADASGNATVVPSVVTVRAAAGPATSSASLTQALRPPENITRLRAQTGDRRVMLTWQESAETDFEEYVVTRSSAQAGRAAETVVYRGLASSFTDRGLRNGVEYRYVVYVHDRAGNRSSGVAVLVTPSLMLLVRPRDGAHVRPPVALEWVRSPKASYYNVQLYRITARGPAAAGGGIKVLSAWPEKPRLDLEPAWVYDGRSRRLSPGRYRWYVWPGLGSPAEKRYGGLLGEAEFVVTG